jgi:hypothetical protein
VATIVAGASGAFVVTAMPGCDDCSRLTRDCRSDLPLAATIETNGIIKIENESKHAINIFTSRRVVFREKWTFMGFSWVRASL